MKRIIWKFEIIPFEFVIVLPSTNFKFLHVNMQGDNPMLWVEVEIPESGLADLPTNSLFRAKLKVIPTGGEIPMDAAHIGSWLMHSGSLVWHLYQII